MRWSTEMLSDTSIIFDLDGVLLDSESDLSWLYQALEKTLRKMDVPITEKYLNLIHSKNVHRLPDLTSSFDMDFKKLWEIRNQYYIDEKLAAMENGTIKPFKDVKELFRLHGLYELGVLSNSPQIVVERFISLYNFDGLFSIAIGRGNDYDDIKLMKPHHFMMSKLREQTTNTKFIYIGDLETDRLFAKQNNMNFMYLIRGGKINNYKMSYNSLSEVVQALI